MKILIAVPTFENITVECFKAIYALDKCGHEVDFESVKGYDCAKARNVISRKAIDGGYDYVLMIDSDTIVPKDALKHLLEGDADLVIGCCPKKTNEKETVLFELKDNAKGIGFVKVLTYADLQKADRIDLRGGGFACVLINTKVYSKMKYPYFKYIVRENGNALSEDLYFCKEAGNLGFRIQADTRVKCGHLTKKILHGQV